jgi:pSer/pThr/pTyr-binding forkhead associated (FHA) protein
MSLPHFQVRRLSGSRKGAMENHSESELSFGTGPGNTVRFDPTWDKGVSSRHARVFRDHQGQVWIEDAGSGSGTFVNGKRITIKQKNHRFHGH